MADSDNESDFASAESDHAEPGTPEAKDNHEIEHSEASTSKKNVQDTDRQEEREPEMEGADNTPTIPSETKDTTDQPEHSTQSVGGDDQVTSKDLSEEGGASKDPPEEGGENPPNPKPPTQESSGSWGWGGWSDLWSSVSTVTESAQALGQKVLCCQIHIVMSFGLQSVVA